MVRRVDQIIRRLPELRAGKGASRRSGVFALLAAMCLAALVGAPMVKARQAGIVLDRSKTYQTIEGWEATAQAGQIDSPYFASYKDDLFDQAAYDLGINRLRLEVRSGSENTRDLFPQLLAGQITDREWSASVDQIVNDDSDPTTVNEQGFQFSKLDHSVENVVEPMRARLAAVGGRLQIVLTYVDFRTTGFRHKDYPDEYAEFILAVFRHLDERYGWVPDGVEVILEPDRSRWSGREVGVALVAAGRRLEAHGYFPAFIAPSTAEMHSAPVYFDEMLQVDGVLTYLKQISYHRYSGISRTALQGIASRAQQYRLTTAMLEHIGSDQDSLHEDLKIGMGSAWQQYTLAYPTRDNGAQYYIIDDSNPSQVRARPGARTGFLRQYFRYIKSGAVRFDAQSPDPRWDPLAFENPGGLQVVVLKAGRGGTTTVRGLKAGTYGRSYTTAGAVGVDAGEVSIQAGEAIPVTMADAGVMTIYGVTLADGDR